MSREYPCVYHKDGKCEKHQEPGYVSWCVMGPCSEETPSNADRIRAMSDEELAEWLNSFGGDLFCPNKKECVELVNADRDIPAERCHRCIMDWLQQPVGGRMTTMCDFIQCGPPEGRCGGACTGAAARNVRESVYPDGDTGILACPRCGSSEYLTNEDGNKNCFCGQCGQALDWTEPEV